MSFGRRLLESLDSLIDRALCVAGAVLFSQAPEFFQQYLQRSADISTRRDAN